PNGPSDSPRARRLSSAAAVAKAPCASTVAKARIFGSIAAMRASMMCVTSLTLTLRRATASAMRVAGHWCSESVMRDWSVGFKEEARQRRNRRLRTNHATAPVHAANSNLESFDQSWEYQQMCLCRCEL